jgi:phage tail-like protein
MSVTQKSSIAHLATDPLRNFKFVVTIYPNSGGANPQSRAINLGFMAVSGFNITTEVIAYREGAMNTTTQKMPGQSDFSPITMSRGVAVGHQEDWDWQQMLFTVQQGTGDAPPGTEFRRTIDVKLLDHPVTTAQVPIKAWFRIYNAWPTALSFADFDAGASQLMVSQITLAHEGFGYKLAKKIGTDEVSF